MSVTILITEEQKNKILLKESSGQIINVIKKNYDRVKSIIEESSEQIGMNLQFLITWGASIGGFVGPVEDFVRGKLSKTDTFLSVFLDFIASLGLTLHKITNMLSYTFIIPLLGTLLNMTKNMSVDSRDIDEIVLRLTSFGLLTVSGIVIKQLINRIVRRFKEKDNR